MAQSLKGRSLLSLKDYSPDEIIASMRAKILRYYLKKLLLGLAVHSLSLQMI